MCPLLCFHGTPVREVPQGPDLNVRSKDRLSYEHQVVQVDLTQVTTDVSCSSLSSPHETFPRRPCCSQPSLTLASPALAAPSLCAHTQDGKKRHELEVEIVNAPLMLAEAEAAEKEENNCYEQLVAVLVSSVRLLIRNAS